MRKWTKVIPALAVTAALAFPMTTFAHSGNQPEVDAKYHLLPKVEVTDSTIDIWTSIFGASTVDSGEWQIIPVGPNKAGKPAHLNQSTKAQFHAHFEGLKPSVEYCFNIHFTGKLDGDKVNTALMLKGKKGNLFCVKTDDGKPGHDNPGDHNGGGTNPGDDNGGGTAPGDNGNNGGNNGGTTQPGNGGNNGGNNGGTTQPSNDGNNGGNNGGNSGNTGNQPSNGQGGKLPKTATSYANNIGLGATLLAAGLGMLIHRRRQTV
ncbi:MULTISPECIES: LPXTG cell wall anchor domain-containing protein [Thermoactinomyces]|uniref:LPXTG cell wall anchor domain-containing protein n=1 Tax=Thermoactinomyces daqus TaxID=1329516 RepID=A0A7W1XAL2_9BACL|nr:MULTISPECIES: LPXTG cell wall anchor domain-containing protein [Thermoactinomyces]MBA4543053.1 LPXTG cell wall anchor domain-containing protein [Thermoactinomyces daqus]MBH8598714.1 LPXTG cell wall anchor domain-containing protein [Thermoactinomyces sp. CICC 10523]MBH8605540.1 LPXTG cell wall anchor domain-containing protein [Thermoactinomyces sp. CICC 10522]